MYLIGVILFPAYNKWPRLANLSKWAGLPIIAVALVGGSFATKVNHLIATQGALYAIGGSLIYCPALVFLDEWFIERKGLAFGVMWVRDSNIILILSLTLVGWERCRRACGTIYLKRPSRKVWV